MSIIPKCSGFFSLLFLSEMGKSKAQNDVGKDGNCLENMTKSGK